MSEDKRRAGKSVIASFNLIITHLPGYDEKREAAKHIHWLLDEYEIVESRPNIMLLRIPNPDDAAARLARSLPENTPILRVIPVHAVTYPSVENVREVVHELMRGRKGSFAIKLDGHLLDSEGARMHKTDAIRIVAEGIENPVNLSNPDILVYIKIVRYRRNYLAAIYVGSPEGIVSTRKRNQ